MNYYESADVRGTQLTFSRLDAAGHRLEHAVHLTTGSSFDWSTGCLAGGPVTSGQRLVLKKGTQTIRSFVVPPFSVRVERGTDVFRINAPTTGDVHFMLQACFPATDSHGASLSCGSFAVDVPHILMPVDGTFAGSWHGGSSPNPYRARGGDDATLTLINDATGDSINALSDVPYLQVERGSATVTGAARPGSTVHVTLRNSHGTTRGTGSATVHSNGRWSARVRHNGSLVTVRSGDTAKSDVASNATLRVITPSLHVDLTADTAHGTCLPKGRYTAIFDDPSGPSQTLRSGDADSVGAWSATGLNQVQSGWDVRLWCASRYGDAIFRRLVVP